MKTPITFILCAALVLLPFRSSAPDSPPPPDNQPPVVAIACVVLVVGAVVIYGLWKLCKRIPVLNDPPPETNAPPVLPPGTNTNRLHKSAWVMPRLQMPERDDLLVMTNWQIVVACFQNSSNLVDWTDCLYVTNWIGATNAVCVAADASGPVATNFTLGPNGNGEVICDFGFLPQLLPQGDRRFYRMVELQ